MTTMSDRAAQQAKRDVEIARVHEENAKLRERIAELEGLPIMPSLDYPEDPKGTTRCMICRAETEGAELCAKHTDWIDG